MAGYIGHKPKLAKYAVDEFTTSSAQASSGNFTLSQTVTDERSLEVSVGGIDQPQSAYTVSGTTLAFGASIVAENDIVIARHAGESIMYPALEDGVVTDVKISGMNSTKLTGTIDGARFPATLPAADGSALTNIVHTPADNSVTGGKLDISLVAGDTMYASATDTLAKLTKGTAGQVLKMNSGATAPEWGADEGLPTAGADGQVLTSDGTNWASEAAAAGGKVLQIVTNHVTDVSSVSRAIRTAVSIPGLNATITPASTGSKILIQINWCGEDSLVTTQDLMFGIKRGSTNIGDGVDVNGNGIAMTVCSGGYQTEAGSSMDFASYQYIDSPSTISATTYHAYVYHSVTAGTLHTNRTNVDGSSNFAYERAASSITLTELSSATILLNGS